MAVNRARLMQVVTDLHGCGATWVESRPVREVFEGRTIWDGVVEIFDLDGHPSATRCYAWASPVEGSDRPRYYAVLHQPPVDSPAAAVRAAIVRDFKTQK
jgi:hypothetical protein